MKDYFFTSFHSVLNLLLQHFKHLDLFVQSLMTSSKDDGADDDEDEDEQSGRNHSTDNDTNVDGRRRVLYVSRVKYQVSMDNL